MKTKTFSILFALVMILSLSVGVFAQDFDETWDENTVLTVFNDIDMVFPDLFADIDSNFLWTDDKGPRPFNNAFPSDNGKPIAKAPLADGEYQLDANGNVIVDANGIPVSTSFYDGKFTFDPCGDGLIKFETTLFKMDMEDARNQGYYYGDVNTTYIRDITATLYDYGKAPDLVTYKLGLKKCEGRGGEGCSVITYKKQGDFWTAKLTGYLTVPEAAVLTGATTADAWLEMKIDFSDYMTALWPVDNTQGFGDDSGTVMVAGPLTANPKLKKAYCQYSLEEYGGMGYSTRAKYDENTGEARLQTVVRNIQPDINRQNYVIPGEVYVWTDNESQRITDYTCKYTLYNVANAAPRTDYCKFGEGIAIPDHGMVRIDISIDHFSGAILRDADGGLVPFGLRLGGMTTSIFGAFEPVEFPCPPVSRMSVKDPLHPFMTFFNLIGDKTISPSGAYGVYEDGLWGMYQKCGKFAYVMVRLANDGVKGEIVDLNNTAVAINGGTPMSFNWVLSTIEPDKKDKIYLDGGEEVILIGRAKVTDIPSQLNSDLAMTGAVNFPDFGFYITGKVFSDHNNTNCVAAPK